MLVQSTVSSAPKFENGVTKVFESELKILCLKLCS